MPAAVVTHIPILGITPLLQYQGTHAVTVPFKVIARDRERLSDLFGQYQVQLVLSGHMHQCERVLFRGVRYICGGAVSGNWWRGDHQGFKPGFGIIDAYPNGHIEYAYHVYGWRSPDPTDGPRR